MTTPYIKAVEMFRVLNGEPVRKSFIETQQELVRQWNKDVFSDQDLDTLITEIITNTGEELMRLAEGEKIEIESHGYDYEAVDFGARKALDTMKKHITKLTGVDKI